MSRYFLNLRRIDEGGQPLPKVTVAVELMDRYNHYGSQKVSFIITQAICKESKKLDLVGLRGSITEKEFDENATLV